MGLGGAISNLLSLGAKLLPAVQASSSASSSSRLPEDHQDHKIQLELERLMRMLERIKATLYDAEQREIREKAVELWLKELRGVAHDAEDVLDEYNYEVLRAEVEAREANPRKRKPVEVLDGMFHQIQQIRSKFAEIEKDRIALRLSEEDGPKHCNGEFQIAPTSHVIDETGIFGREKEKNELIDLLLSESHHDRVVSVVAIVGPGGLGKTTLAQLAYNDQKIKQRFDIFVWIFVSEDFNIERLTRELLESIKGNKQDLTNLSVLQKNIIEAIREKRVLLVLDDVWNEKRSLWDSFQAPFKSASFMKILVTTRNEPVARIMQTMPTFNLGYISREQCWQLFKHYAFGGVNRNDSKFVELGEQILGKCGMLPLAVKSIASLLRHEMRIESWREVLESELWESDASNEIFAPLQLSYVRLPTYLKPCLVFCSMFPKDYVFFREYLVDLWISQGYIESKGKKRAQEIGQEYINQLWQRSFFSASVVFTLHDMIHDLARYNSKKGCLSIEAGSSSNFPGYSNELNHLYIAYPRITDPIHFEKLTTLRTLIIKGLRFENHNISLPQKLRALEMHDCMKRVSNFIGHNHQVEFAFLFNDLKHLRYLSLRKWPSKMIPKCIWSLYNLQILKLTYCVFEELPTSIGNLICLENLEIEYCNFLKWLPESLCQLKALRSLHIYSCSGLQKLPTDIGNLVSLEILKIEYCDSLERLPESICQLKVLSDITLRCCGKLEELPRSIGILTNLKTLNIDGCQFSLPPSCSKHIGIQTIIPPLRCEAIGWLKDSANTVQTLYFLGLENMTNLTDVRYCANLASMPNLEGVQLCWEYNSINTDDNVFYLYIKRGQNQSNGDQNDFVVMAGLQPHPNLRALRIYGYGGSTFPEWIGAPSSCASLERLDIEACKKLHLFPFGSLCKLKYLNISGCDNLVFLKAESLPPGLQELMISNCGELISVPGIQKLKSLISLSITCCENLRFLLVDAELSLELNMCSSESSYRKSLLGLKDLTSLRSLKIHKCPKLQLLVDELLCVESCEVEVRYCPLLQEWCLQHGIHYEDSFQNE